MSQIGETIERETNPSAAKLVSTWYQSYHLKKVPWHAMTYTCSVASLRTVFFQQHHQLGLDMMTPVWNGRGMLRAKYFQQENQDKPRSGPTWSQYASPMARLRNPKIRYTGIRYRSTLCRVPKEGISFKYVVHIRHIHYMYYTYYILQISLTLNYLHSTYYCNALLEHSTRIYIGYTMSNYFKWFLGKDAHSQRNNQRWTKCPEDHCQRHLGAWRPGPRYPAAIQSAGPSVEKMWWRVSWMP